jgi:hypothetical protein
MTAREIQPGSLNCHFLLASGYADNGFTSVLTDFSAESLPTRPAQCNR